MGKSIVFDIDETLTIKAGVDYTIDSLPNVPMIERLRTLYNQGWYIILFTARKMGSNHSNVGRALAQGGYNTFKWLEKHNVPFDEIHWGKPNTDTVYIDDKAFGYDEKKVLQYLDNLIQGKTNE